MSEPGAFPPPVPREPVAPPSAVDGLEPVAGKAPGLDPSGPPEPRTPEHLHLAEHHAPVHRRRVAMGRVALAVALAMVVAVVVALGLDGPERYAAATILALVADLLSLIAIVLGIAAAVRGSSRVAAVAALVIAVLGNPLVLLYGLGALT